MRITETDSDRVLGNIRGDTIQLTAENIAQSSVDASICHRFGKQDNTDLLSRSLKFLGGELKETADETLFLELARRGYDLSKPLRPDADETDNPAEIVKIG